ncbi:MAG: PatA/PatG family cyanobactin maturation protease [Desulfobacteraceae bacterium]|nr:PatA/PatG family cyanobactin maturation protease [Desulfobacteraceae bacterium]
MEKNSTMVESNSNMAFWTEVRALQKETLGVPEIKIAIIDGPVDSSHHCFNGVRLVQLNTLAAPARGGAGSNHGTHVTSIILGRHGGAVPGIAPGCHGLIVPIFEQKDRLMPCRQIDLAHAINQAVNHGAHVINISGGESADPKHIDLFLKQAILHCARKNVLIVAAAGNDGCQCTHVPAAGPGVLVVGAMDSRNMPIELSNWGDAYQTRGILAPGQEITGAVPGGGISTVSGTSFATAIVSGTAGLLLSMQLKRGDKPDPHFIGRAILESARPCNPQTGSDCRKYLSGSLNITGAYSLVKKAPGPAMHRGLSENGFHGKMASVIQPAAPRMPPILSTSGLNASSIPGSNPAKEVTETGTTNGRIGPDDPAPGKTVTQGKTSKVYVISRLGFDYGSVAVRDTYKEKMEAIGLFPDSPSDLLRHLDAYSHEPQEVSNIIWTLTINDTPVYAIRPSPAFSGVIYQRLMRYLEKQIGDENHMITIAGVIAGTKRLLSGQRVPVVIPNPRLMNQWTIETLIEGLLGEAPHADNERVIFHKKEAGVRDFLYRLINDFSNMGIAPGDRVLNFAATRALEIRQVFESAVENEMRFTDIRVNQLNFQRPGSQCREVVLMFSDPKKPSRRAGRRYGFTVDVSEVIPVTIGEVRSWSVY